MLYHDEDEWLCVGKRGLALKEGVFMRFKHIITY
jgi:hypothetical protein